MRKITLLFVCISALVTAQEIELTEADAILDDLFEADSLDILDLFDDLKKQDYLYVTVLYNWHKQTQVFVKPAIADKL